MDANSVEPRIVSWLYQKATREKIPLGATFEVSPLCNMNCAMCYVKLTKEEQEKRGRLRTKKEWLELAAELKKEGMLFLLLTGGEPFLRSDFKELYIELQKMGFCLSINSNGTLIDEETVNWLVQYPPERINITLYGASNETYERLCGNPTGFTKVTKAIDNLTNAGISVKLNCSLTPYNKDDIKEIIDFANERKLIVEVAAYMFPPMRRDNSMIGQNQRFTPKEAAHMMLEISRLQNGEERFRNYIKSGEFPPVASEECQEEGDIIRCRAGRSSCWVTWDGRLLACGMMDYPQISLERGKFREAWDYIAEEVDKIRLSQKCNDCSSKDKCHTCAAMTLTETGSFDKTPEYRCQLMEEYLRECNDFKSKLLQEEEQA